jgi:hypothetical protein
MVKGEIAVIVSSDASTSGEKSIFDSARQASSIVTQKVDDISQQLAQLSNTFAKGISKSLDMTQPYRLDAIELTVECTSKGELRANRFCIGRS